MKNGKRVLILNKTNHTIPPYSMEVMTAKLFTEIDKVVVSKYKEKGKELLKQGVKNFGYKDAEDIAIKATTEKENHTLFDYIPKDHHTSNNYEGLTPFALFAKLFAQVTKVVVDSYGAEGKEVIQEGVRIFGENRGNGIAQRARVNGAENTIDQYLSNYDMGRSELFEYDSIFDPENIEQTFTKCPFGQQWADDNMHEYGILYCQMIDPAIAKGYNPDFEVEHDKYVLEEGVCHFNFKLKEKKADQND
jgi:hypothetical protein